MIETVRVILFVVLLVAFGTWITRRKWLNDEIDRNDRVDPPSSRQLRWDIRHMREDLHMLVLINYALFIAVLFVICFMSWRT
jgi:hypothetical protein